MHGNTLTKGMALAAMMAIGSHAEIVGSLLTQGNSTDYTDVVSITNLSSRLNSGNGGGVMAGTVSAIAGDSDGAGSDPVYLGMDTVSYTENSQFRDLSRFGGHTALISYDYDFSSYLTTHEAGTDAGDFTYTLDINLEGRRTSNGRDVEFYLSYNNGSSLSLDTTQIFGLTAGDTTAFDALAANTAKYTLAGTHLGNNATGVYSWDITSHIATSTDGQLRVLVKDDGEYLGDIRFNNGSGISAVEVIPEPATLGLISVFGGAVLVIRRRFMI